MKICTAHRALSKNLQALQTSTKTPNSHKINNRIHELAIANAFVQIMNTRSIKNAPQERLA